MRTPVFLVALARAFAGRRTVRFQEADRDRRPMSPRAVVVKTVPPVPAGL